MVMRAVSFMQKLAHDMLAYRHTQYGALEMMEDIGPVRIFTGYACAFILIKYASRVGSDRLRVDD